MSDNVSFEQLRAELERLVPPIAAGDRNIYWVSARNLGIAKTQSEALELFLAGPKLHPRTATVRRHLEHARWEIAGSGDQLDASRIVFPPAAHFLAIAALIAIELVRVGINDTRPLQDVFDEVEPIIELALRQGTLGEEHLVGLLGELICLEVMLDTVIARPELRMYVLDMWQGHRPGLRDFVIGSASIEVKTTQQDSSSHKVSGLHQVEPVGTEVEKELFLLSVGLAESEHEGQALPEVVQRILDRLAGPNTSSTGNNNLTPLQQRFLDDVSHYGSTSSRGYDHRVMSAWKVFDARYRTTFTPRLYDLMDEDVRILRRRDLAGTHVSLEDIQYRIDLQPTINGLNPSPSWQHAVADLVREALSLS